MKHYLAILSLCWCAHVNAQSLTIGESAPNLIANTLQGEQFNLSQFKNQRPVYLKFWATWCQYCLAEMPYLNAIQVKYAEHIEVLTVNVGMNDSIANIQAYFARNNLALPTIFDSQGKITQDFGVLGTPYHVLIDSNGKVAMTSFLHSEKIDTTIQKLIK